LETLVCAAALKQITDRRRAWKRSSAESASHRPSAGRSARGQSCSPITVSLSEAYMDLNISLEANCRPPQRTEAPHEPYFKWASQISPVREPQGGWPRAACCMPHGSGCLGSTVRSSQLSRRALGSTASQTSFLNQPTMVL
jgi:hypothetical protein